MDELPGDLTEECWGAGRAVPLIQALDELLDVMQDRLTADCPDVVEVDADPVPLSTGLPPLDRVLRGGVRHGTVTFVEADVEAQGTALLNTVARRIQSGCLVDGRRFFEVVAGLLSGSAGVPRVSVLDAAMSEREWDSFQTAITQLVDLDISISSTGSILALSDVALSSGVTVVLVHDAGRFGPPIEVVPKLANLAATGGMAVLAATRPMGRLPEWALERVTRIRMCSYELGGRASLVRPDPEEMLAVEQVGVDCLSGIVRW